MGKLWRVDEALEKSEGVRWIRERLEAYDWSKIGWITVRRGRVSGTRFGACVSRLRRDAGTGSTAT